MRPFSHFFQVHEEFEDSIEAIRQDEIKRLSAKKEDGTATVEDLNQLAKFLNPGQDEEPEEVPAAEEPAAEEPAVEEPAVEEPEVPSRRRTDSIYGDIDDEPEEQAVERRKAQDTFDANKSAWGIHDDEDVNISIHKDVREDLQDQVGKALRAQKSGNPQRIATTRKAVAPLILWGDPGIGKTVSTRDTAKRNAEKAGRVFKHFTLDNIKPNNEEWREVRENPGKYYVLLELRITTMNISELLGTVQETGGPIKFGHDMSDEDLEGIMNQTANQDEIENNATSIEKKFIDIVFPGGEYGWRAFINNKDEDPGNPAMGMIFFDEFNLVESPMWLSTIMPFIDRNPAGVIHEPLNWTIVAAGNVGPQYRGTIVQPSPAFIARGKQHYMMFSVGEWLKWAEGSDSMSDYVVRYIKDGVEDDDEYHDVSVEPDANGNHPGSQDGASNRISYSRRRVQGSIVKVINPRDVESIGISMELAVTDLEKGDITKKEFPAAIRSSWTFAPASWRKGFVGWLQEHEISFDDMIADVLDRPEEVKPANLQKKLGGMMQNALTRSTIGYEANPDERLGGTYPRKSFTDIDKQWVKIHQFDADRVGKPKLKKLENLILAMSQADSETLTNMMATGVEEFDIEQKDVNKNVPFSRSHLIFLLVDLMYGTENHEDKSMDELNFRDLDVDEAFRCRFARFISQEDDHVLERLKDTDRYINSITYGIFGGIKKLGSGGRARGYAPEDDSHYITQPIIDLGTEKEKYAAHWDIVLANVQNYINHKCAKEDAPRYGPKEDIGKQPGEKGIPFDFGGMDIDSGEERSEEPEEPQEIGAPALTGPGVIISTDSPEQAEEVLKLIKRDMVQFGPGQKDPEIVGRHIKIEVGELSTKDDVPWTYPANKVKMNFGDNIKFRYSTQARESINMMNLPLNDLSFNDLLLIDTHYNGK